MKQRARRPLDVSEPADLRTSAIASPLWWGTLGFSPSRRRRSRSRPFAYFYLGCAKCGMAARRSAAGAVVWARRHSPASRVLRRTTGRERQRSG